MTEWQPISTAPSGDILISDGKHVTLMEWFEGEEDWNRAQQWATHWMPLPPPPSPASTTHSAKSGKNDPTPREG